MSEFGWSWVQVCFLRDGSPFRSDSPYPGPDPNSATREITDCLPSPIAHQGSLRIPRHTGNDRSTRAAELKAFVEALFKDDVPALVDDLKREHIVLRLLWILATRL
jgi:hypothetical protein